MALGFERGETEFGVSGMLVNSNLIMYDRATDSYWPQILGTAVQGPHRGDGLRQIRVFWTTWERWRSRHPDTRVLSPDTRHMRNYRQDPYGFPDSAAGAAGAGGIRGVLRLAGAVVHSGPGSQPPLAAPKRRIADVSLAEMAAGPPLMLKEYTRAAWWGIVHLYVNDKKVASHDHRSNAQAGMTGVLEVR